MPRGSQRPTHALVAALVSAVAVTACAPFATDANPTRQRSSHTATTSAPRATGPSASATPTPSPVGYPALGPLPDGVAPARPAALDRPPTLEGAKAVATYFLLLYPYAYQTGDLAAWNALSHADCIFCSSVRGHVSDASTAGQHTVGGAFRITAVQGTEVDPAKYFDIQLAAEGAPSQVVGITGSVAKDQAAGRYVTYVVVVVENGAWRVRGVQPEQAQ